MNCWYNPSEIQSTIAISTRIRLARNINGFPFPSKMTPEQFNEVNNLVRNAISESNNPIVKTLKYISMDDIPDIERFAMVERHIISKNFASNYQNRAIIISEDEKICIMLGEEDHIRIQVLLDAIQLEEAYSIANSIDEILYNKLDIAFDERLGFLTECPSNVGTGMRASVMLHLPMIENKRRIKSLVNAFNKDGLTVRGMYGEGTKALASFYQISNQTTLGISEKETLEKLKVIAVKLVEEETWYRKKGNALEIEDKAMRSYGILKNAKIMTSAELMSRISDVLLGVWLGVINYQKWPIDILIQSQPYMLMKRVGIMPPKSRDVERADFIRNSL